MSIPKDGYYMARVQLDSGGLCPMYVHVKGGKPHDEWGGELLPEACSNFRELSTTLMVRVWPQNAAMELETLRDEVATLQKDQWVPAALLQILELHRIPVGSPELLEAKCAFEAEIDTLRTANAGLVERVKRLDDELADYMKLFCDWKAYATNLESAGKQMLDGGFHAPHIISGWREAEGTRP